MATSRWGWTFELQFEPCQFVFKKSKEGKIRKGGGVAAMRLRRGCGGAAALPHAHGDATRQTFFLKGYTHKLVLKEPSSDYIYTAII
jgi:hypothetical protein